jgi:hypothetical protein
MVTALRPNLENYSRSIEYPPEHPDAGPMLAVTPSFIRFPFN